LEGTSRKENFVKLFRINRYLGSGHCCRARGRVRRSSTRSRRSRIALSNFVAVACIKLDTGAGAANEATICTKLPGREKGVNRGPPHHEIGSTELVTRWVHLEDMVLIIEAMIAEGFAIMEETSTMGNGHRVLDNFQSQVAHCSESCCLHHGTSLICALVREDPGRVTRIINSLALDSV